MFIVGHFPISIPFSSSFLSTSSIKLLTFPPTDELCFSFPHPHSFFSEPTIHSNIALGFWVKKEKGVEMSSGSI